MSVWLVSMNQGLHCMVTWLSFLFWRPQIFPLRLVKFPREGSQSCTGVPDQKRTRNTGNPSTPYVSSIPVFSIVPRNNALQASAGVCTWPGAWMRGGDLEFQLPLNNPTCNRTSGGTWWHSFLDLYLKNFPKYQATFHLFLQWP